jgi:hypothetical protein
MSLCCWRIATEQLAVQAVVAGRSIVAVWLYGDPARRCCSTVPVSELWGTAVVSTLLAKQCYAT